MGRWHCRGRGETQRRRPRPPIIVQWPPSHSPPRTFASSAPLRWAERGIVNGIVPARRPHSSFHTPHSAFPPSPPSLKRDIPIPLNHVKTSAISSQMSVSQTNALPRARTVALTFTPLRTLPSLGQRRAGILPALQASHPVFPSPQGDFIFPHPDFLTLPDPASQEISRGESVASLRHDKITLRKDKISLRNHPSRLRSQLASQRMVKISQRRDKIRVREGNITLRRPFDLQSGLPSIKTAFRACSPILHLRSPIFDSPSSIS